MITIFSDEIVEDTQISTVSEVLIGKQLKISKRFIFFINFKFLTRLRGVRTKQMRAGADRVTVLLTVWSYAVRGRFRCSDYFLRPIM